MWGPVLAQGSKVSSLRLLVQKIGGQSGTIARRKSNWILKGAHWIRASPQPKTPKWIYFFDDSAVNAHDIAQAGQSGMLAGAPRVYGFWWDLYEEHATPDSESASGWQADRPKKGLLGDFPYKKQNFEHYLKDFGVSEEEFGERYAFYAGGGGANLGDDFDKELTAAELRGARGDAADEFEETEQQKLLKERRAIEAEEKKRKALQTRRELLSGLEKLNVNVPGRADHGALNVQLVLAPPKVVMKGVISVSSSPTEPAGIDLKTTDIKDKLAIRRERAGDDSPAEEYFVLFLRNCLSVPTSSPSGEDEQEEESRGGCTTSVEKDLLRWRAPAASSLLEDHIDSAVSKLFPIEYGSARLPADLLQYLHLRTVDNTRRGKGVGGHNKGVGKATVLPGKGIVVKGKGKGGGGDKGKAKGGGAGEAGGKGNSPVDVLP